MTPSRSTDTAERLARLERLAALAFAEHHGLRLAPAGLDFTALRETAASDAAAILREQAEPALERRAGTVRT